MSLKAAIAADKRGNVAIQKALDAGTPIQTGTNAAAVRWVERMLVLHGFKPGTVNNEFTANTAASLKAFQKSWGLPETGTLDKATFNKLKHTQSRVRSSQKAHKGKIDSFGVGQKSGAVLETEKGLRRLGYDVGKADGVFDMKLRDAVIAFRKDQKNLPDGAGVMTGGAREVMRKEGRALSNHGIYRTRVFSKHKPRKRLDAFTAKAAVKKDAEGRVGFGEGAKGKAVANVQSHLKRAGFDPKGTSGNFDERTEAALKAFQRKAGIDPSGRVGPRTWAALQKTYIYAKGNWDPAQRVGERSKSVAATEKVLRKLGYKSVKADGIFDSRTVSAVKRFEKKHHMKVDGTVSKAEFLKMRKIANRPKFNLKTVRGCAQYLLASKNVSFWTGLSTGSDRKNLELLARGKPAFVPATGGHVTPKLSMMRALVDMAKHGRIMINALTGGSHSSNSNHYRGTAVDLEVTVGSPSQIAAIARKYGGARNFETSHIHLDF